jgi:GNAT superfamily N-acetyltransferase
MIIKSDYENILKIWKEHLWPNRVSKIETHSAMLLDRTYDMKNFEYEPTYFLYIVNATIAGCNSGHMCADNTYRSRGLYVFSEFRHHGIGKELLIETITQGKKEKAKLVWSYPRQTSWTTYKNAGFKLISDWETSETSENNAYCSMTL